MKHYAHVKSLPDGTNLVQTVSEHCRNSAELASKCLSGSNLKSAGYLAGLVHDAGKCKAEFQRYLTDPKAVRGSVNHTFAGCRLLLELFHHEKADTFEDVSCEILAYAAGAHHGLFDCIDENQKSGFLHRVQKEGIGYEESKKNFLSECADLDELHALFAEASKELESIFQEIIAMSSQESSETSGISCSYYLGQLTRLLSSAVMEGDRRDTAEFMGSAPKDPVNPSPEMWNKILNHVEQKMEELPHETEIQKARQTISDQCRQAAERPEGVYRLHVPTGAGKTLSSLRYALAHAACKKKKRIFFVTPLLSILDQNAAVIRQFIHDDHLILEHHSNVVQTETGKEELDLRELSVESWHAPVIITTLVQLLNTLFSGKTTAVRRYQALCNAVVVIDEVQTVPNHMLSLFNLAVNFLSRICHTTFLLCSATQPCFERATHPLLLCDHADLVPYSEALWAPFIRTALICEDAKKLEDIPSFAMKSLDGHDSLLIICNKKNEAAFLYQSLSSEDVDCYHLSASMCMAHRRKTLDCIRRSLEAKKERKTVCIATQVIEAGVDISFDCVIRFAAGMDSIVQAAGRCNRNRTQEKTAPVYILPCSDEKLGKLREIQNGKTATLSLLHEFQKCPDSFGYDLASDEAIQWYYQKLYQEETAIENYQMFPVPGIGTLFDLLSSNSEYYDADNPIWGFYQLAQAFKLAGSHFHVFETDAADVITPYGEGASLIEELETKGKFFTIDQWKSWEQRAKPYTVSVYAYQQEKLGSNLRWEAGVPVLDAACYDKNIGLTINPTFKFMEV